MFEKIFFNIFAMKFNSMIFRIGSVIIGVIALLGTTSTFFSTSAAVSIPDVEAKSYASNIDTIINAAPQILFWVLIVFLAIAIGIVVIKALNPLSDDSEEKFSEGRKWFQRTGTLFLFPIILIIVIIIIWSLLGFGNPFTKIEDQSPATQICNIFGGC